MANRKQTSGANPGRASFASVALSQSMNGWLKNRLPNWPRVWAACVGRTHSWRVPPRWNRSDWWEEIDAESIAAACHAIRIFDPNRGPDLGSFVYHQILASALSRYRQEWTYAIRYGSPASEDGGVTPPEDRFAIEQEREELKRTMTSLSEADRSLIQHLFWGGFTETEVASGLGISRQAVNKRKHRILNEMRESFPDEDERRPTKRNRPKL
jgi:RNA polymerase sigma factor (sigma-70 family)